MHINEEEYKKFNIITGEENDLNKKIAIKLMNKGYKVIMYPENKLHPAKHADVFEKIYNKYKDSSKTVCIVTHSECICLKVKHMIKHRKAVSSDFSFHQVVGGEHSYLHENFVHNIRIEEDGDFLDDWYNGFFEEQYNLIFS